MRLDRLPTNITGLFGASELPRSLDVRIFKRACYVVAQSASGSVEQVELHLGRRNYYEARLRTRTDRLSVVCNSVYPYVAFAAGWAAGEDPNLTFVPQVQLGALFAESTDFEPLDSDWLASPVDKELLEDLTEAELRQIRYWKPERVGDVIFNWWD